MTTYLGTWLGSGGGGRAVDIAYATAVPFSYSNAYMPQQTVNGAIAFTVNSAGATKGSSVSLRLVSNNTDTPTFTGMLESGASMGWDGRLGIVNTIYFWYDGVDYWYSIMQAVSPVADFTGLFTNLLASKGKFAFEARNNTNDGTNILTLVDLISPSRVLTPTIGTMPKPTTDSVYANALTCTFSAHQLACSAPASYFRFLHDGTGMETRTIARTASSATQVVLSTRTSTTGTSLILSSLSASLYIGNGGSTVINSIGGGGAQGFTANAAIEVISRFNTGVSPVATQRVNTQGADSTQTSVTSGAAAGDPQSTLLIGSDGTNHFIGRWFGSYGFSTLTATERLIVDGYRRQMVGGV